MTQFDKIKFQSSINIIAELLQLVFSSPPTIEGGTQMRKLNFYLSENKGADQ